MNIAPIRPTAVAVREGYRIWLRYSDGEVDLSHLAGGGVFEAWNDRACFESVHITEYDAIDWGEYLELCPDALYMKLTGKSLAEVMPRAASECYESQHSIRRVLYASTWTTDTNGCHC